MASVSVLLWLAGALGYVDPTWAHPLSYVGLIAAAFLADRHLGRESAANLQLGLNLVAWLLVAFLVVVEGLNLGGLIFFGLIALTVTTVFFQTAFRLSKRLSLYTILLALAWGPVVYCGIYPSYSADSYGPAGFQVFMLLAFGITIFFIVMLVRWLMMEAAHQEARRK